MFCVLVCELLCGFKFEYIEIIGDEVGIVVVEF